MGHGPGLPHDTPPPAERSGPCEKCGGLAACWCSPPAERPVAGWLTDDANEWVRLYGQHADPANDLWYREAVAQRAEVARLTGALEEATELLGHRTDALNVANETTASWRRRADAALALAREAIDFIGGLRLGGQPVGIYAALRAKLDAIATGGGA